MAGWSELSTGKKMGVVALWVVTLALGFQYFMVGANKLLQPDPWLRRFVEEWSLPALLVYPVAAGELLGGMLLVVPKVATYGALMIVVIMLGATGTHLAAGQMQQFPVTLILALVVGAVGWMRRKDAVGPLGTGG